MNEATIEAYALIMIIIFLGILFINSEAKKKKRYSYSSEKSLLNYSIPFKKFKLKK